MFWDRFSYYELCLIRQAMRNTEQIVTGNRTNTESGLGATATLTTGRVLLRAFVRTDAEALFACCRNPELGNNAGWKPHESLDESRRILEEVFLGKETLWAVCDSVSGQLVGSIGLIPDPKRDNPNVLMLGYWLDQAYWGRGVMTDASRAVLEFGFKELGLAVITVTCYPQNIRSKRLIERLGFRFEGVLHAAVRDHRGETYDLLSYYLPNEVPEHSERG